MVICFIKQFSEDSCFASKCFILNRFKVINSDKETGPENHLEIFFSNIQQALKQIRFVFLICRSVAIYRGVIRLI